MGMIRLELVESGLEDDPQPLDQLGCVGEERLSRGPVPLLHVEVQLLDEVILRREVVVRRPHRHPQLVGQPPDRRRVVPVLAK